MLLAIDVGNTQIAVGVFREDNLIAHWRIATSVSRTEDETWVLLQSLSSEQEIKLKEISGVAISSVVPNVTAAFVKLSLKYLHLNPVIVNYKTKTDLVIHYDNPANVGADRICNAIAGYEKHGGPLIIVDFGTATTFDIISKNREYLGGIIAPGIEMSSMILHQKAAKLPSVELNFPDKVIGQSTEVSMQSGLLYGTVEMVNGFVNRINAELKQDAKIIVTGGLAKLVLQKLGEDFILEPFLTLEGLKIIFENSK
ncbi:type III pantothenate kinase [candidate division KSB1 bacterium]|nr:type III pantothenate kinase [candidate division KSB1 bacterium]